MKNDSIGRNRMLHPKSRITTKDGSHKGFNIQEGVIYKHFEYTKPSDKTRSVFNLP